MKKFKLLDKVRWQWGPRTGYHGQWLHGLIVGIVEAGKPPHEGFLIKWLKAGEFRDHESYVIQVNNLDFRWPQVSELEKIEHF